MEGIEALLSAAEILQASTGFDLLLRAADELQHRPPNGIDLILKASELPITPFETSDSGIFSYANSSLVESDVENVTPVKRSKRLIKRRRPYENRRKPIPISSSEEDTDDINGSFEQFASDYLRFDDEELNAELMKYNPRMARKVVVSDKSVSGERRRVKNMSACRISRAKRKVLLKKKLLFYSALSDDNSALSDCWSQLMSEVPLLLDGTSDSSNSSSDAFLDCTVLKYVL